MDKTTPYYGAFVRALVVGFLSGVSTFLVTWSTTDDAKTIAIAAAAAFLAPFLLGSEERERMTRIGTRRSPPEL